MAISKALLSVDSAKAVKAQGYGYLNGIHYMAPASSAGVGNLCQGASQGCITHCLGIYSGQAAMVADLEHGVNNVRASRIAKARAFMANRAEYLNELGLAIAKLRRQAAADGLKPVARLNGSTDIPFERMAFVIGARLAKAIGAQAGARMTLLAAFPDVQFVDYTKIASRLVKAPANLSLTFSRSETNESECVDALAAGHNVAVIFGDGLPDTWNGYPVIDGDKHDLRHLDPIGVVVGLSPKGAKIKTDRTGFVVWGDSARRAAA